MFQPDDADDTDDPTRDGRDTVERMGDALAAPWRRWTATTFGANAGAVLEALLYLALIALVVWLWSAPEADFRYWGF